MKMTVPKSMWFKPVAAPESKSKSNGRPLPIVEPFSKMTRSGNRRVVLYMFTAGRWSLAVWANGAVLTSPLTQSCRARLSEEPPMQGQEAVSFAKEFAKLVGPFGDVFREDIMRHMVFQYR